MNTGTQHNFAKLLVWLVLAVFLLPDTQADEFGLEGELQTLDEEFQQLVNDYYKDNRSQIEVIDDINLLTADFDQLNSQQQPASAYQLVFANLKTISENSDHPSIPQLVGHLLSDNQRLLAELIYDQVENTGDESSLNNLNFVFARYYAQHRQWQRVENFIKDSFDDLVGSNSDYAYLLQGTALQHLKQHRKSVESYANVPVSSPYYLHARLNTALASIRQGWITEARQIIEPLLADNPDKSNELINRIYLVLGYALLQKEYYRDARKSFRQISRDSQYANRALMGISLAAISQGDYVGGLNTVTVLKQGKGNDLSSDEAYLVMPYIFEKLDQPLSISSSFSESVDHYQSRLLQLSAIRNSPLNFDTLKLEAITGDLTLDGIRFNFSRQYPGYVLQNRRFLGQLLVSESSTKHGNRIATLINKYDQILTDIVFRLIDQRKQFVSSYLNQSRYGLARHYDNQQAGGEQ